MATFRQMHLDALDLEQQRLAEAELTGNREEIEASEARINHGVERLAALDRGEVPDALIEEAADEAEAAAERKFVDSLPF